MSETEFEVPGLGRSVRTTRAYLAVVATALVALVGGSALFPRAVYGGFIWKYFWGPVYADAHGWTCAILQPADGWSVVRGGSRAACRGEPYGAIIGYNAVNEVGYALTLVFAVVGVVLLLRRLDIGESPDLFFGLLPFMFLGGALRVVEDANVAALRAGGDAAFSYPWSALIISPVIYFTMFVVALVALGVAIRLERSGQIESYHRALAGIGTAVLALTLLVLVGLAFTREYVYFLPQFTVVVVGIATFVTWLIWQGIEEYAPALKDGTGRIGAVVIWGHAVDGTANVVGLDWGAELGYPAGDLVGKHPVNRFVVDATNAVLPASVTGVIGDAWPFLLLKLVVVLFVLSVFDDQIMEDSPRYSVLMLVAILAVGLGPGTRDMLRATFGI
jgi:uncharacterized membrane protein